MKPPFEIKICETTYELRYTPNALMGLENYLGKSAMKFIEREAVTPDELLKIETLANFTYRGIQQSLKDGRDLEWVLKNLPITKMTDLLQTIMHAIMFAYGFNLDEMAADAPSKNGKAAKKKVKAT